MPLDVSWEIITLQDEEHSKFVWWADHSVLIANLNGRIDSQFSFDDETKSIIVNACWKNWGTVANMIMKYSHVW